MKLLKFKKDDYIQCRRKGKKGFRAYKVLGHHLDREGNYVYELFNLITNNIHEVKARTVRKHYKLIGSNIDVEFAKLLYNGHK